MKMGTLAAGVVLTVSLCGMTGLAAQIPGPEGAQEIPLEIESETTQKLIGKREVTIGLPAEWEPERESELPEAPEMEAPLTETPEESEPEAPEHSACPVTPEGYALTSWDEGERIVFALEKDALPTDEPEPWMETVTVVFLEEDDLAEALEAGDVDAAITDFFWDGELPAGYAVWQEEAAEGEPLETEWQLIVCAGLEAQGAALTDDPWSALESVADWYWK